MGLGIRRIYPLQRGKTSHPQKRGVLGMTLNCIWCWGSSSGTLGSVECSFTITQRSTLTQNGITVIFWPSTWPKMPFRVMHRKEVTHSDGSYERKSRGRKMADEMGRAKKSHDTLMDWRTGREWPLNCMTVISAWWRLNMRFQRSRWRSSGRWTII